MASKSTCFGDALVSSSFLLVQVRHLLLLAMHLFLVASCYYQLFLRRACLEAVAEIFDDLLVQLHEEDGDELRVRLLHAQLASAMWEALLSCTDALTSDRSPKQKETGIEFSSYLLLLVRHLLLVAMHLFLVELVRIGFSRKQMGLRGVLHWLGPKTRLPCEGSK